MNSNNIFRILSMSLFIFNCQYIQAGPVIRPSRMVREIYPEVEQEIPENSNQAQVCIVGDVVYGLGENVPSEQPCLKCLCTPPDVRCETEICVPQPGCKAIHRPNKCCPDYQCECQHEGKTYANGERLPMAPGGECWVCYCRGGEVQCAEVGCYTRSDCKPRYVTGQCCPKYDHCPPRDSLSDRIQYTTESQLSSIDDQITTFTSPSFNATKINSQLFSTDSIEEGSGEIIASSQSILTEEILITTPHPQLIASEETKPRVVTPVTFSIKEIELKSNTNKRTDAPLHKADKSTQTDTDGRPQITIQEVIPPRSEYKPPMIASVHKEAVSISSINPVTYKIDITTSAPMKSVTETNSNDLNDNESFASEKTEIYDHPPPVLRIGDQLLFIKQGQLVPEKDASTPTPIITLIGAEGLQIGLGSGETEQEIMPKEEISTSIEPQSDMPSSNLPSSVPTKSDVEIKEDINTSTSAPAIKVVSAEENEAIPTESNSNESDSSEVGVFIFISSPKPDIPESTSNNAEISEQTTPVSIPTQSFSTETSPTAAVKSGTPETSEYIPEENPYYPPIPEDILNVEQEEITTEQGRSTSKLNPASTSDANVINSTEINDISTSKPNESPEISVIPLQPFKGLVIEKKSSDPVIVKKSEHSDTKILPDFLDIIANSTHSPYTGENKTATPLEWLKHEENDNKPTRVSIPLMNEKAALPDSILSLPAASDFVEDTEIETTTTNIPTLATSPTKLKVVDDNSNSKNSESLKILAKADDVKEIEYINTTQKPENKEEKTPEKIIVVEPNESKETIELNDDTFDSGERTTSGKKFSSLMSNEDASVETIVNNSPEESSEVEMMPGFQKPTEKSPIKPMPKEEEIIEDKYSSSEEKLHSKEDIPVNDEGVTDVSVKLRKSPKNEVEIINMNTDKVVNEDRSHAETKSGDFHEEIRKRDVVKKVLKDMFENPKENIQTEVLSDSDPDTVTDYPDYSSEELNNVKPNENILQNKNVASNSTKIILHKTSTAKPNIEENKKTSSNNNSQDNVQVLNNDNISEEKSSEKLSATTLSVLRDFFKTQFKQFHNSKLTD